MTFTYPNDTQFIWPIPSTGGGGVTDVDGISGSVTLVAGSGITITDNSPSAGSITIAATGGGSSTYKAEMRTISAGEATAKQLILTQTPTAPTEVVVSAINGSTQFYGDDYTVTGTTLDWNGLGLDTIGLVAGDKLVIEYRY